MPEQTHPPYVSGAVTIPRQLERWLDINPQNGPLKRTETYVSVPAFNIAHVWNGYSEIVGEYHFEAPNNISLKIPHDGNLVPIGTNYTMCVSYVNNDNTVVRYSLIRGSGDLFYLTLVPYSGQLIKKNFRIELWNTSQVSCSEVFTTIIYTSVLGNQDYRYGTDSQLKQADPLCKGQQSIGQTVLSPVNDGGPSITLWLDGASGVTTTTWTDRASGILLSRTAGATVLVVTPPNSVAFTNTKLEGTILANVADIFLNIRVTLSGTINILRFSSGGNYIQIRQVGAHFFGIDINGLDTVTSNVASDGTSEYIIRVTSTSGGGTTFWLYNLAGVLLFTGHSIFGYNLNNPVTVDLGQSSFEIRGTFSAESVLGGDDLFIAFSYAQSLPVGGIAMTLPLTWGGCAAPTLNN